MVGVVTLATPSVGPRLRRGQANQDQIKQGEKVYTAQKCQLCHSIAGKGNKQNPLDGVGKKLSAEESASGLPTGRDGEAGQVHEEAADGRQVRQVAAADLDALVAYMQSLK